jgi:hypothetical protein
MNKTASCLLASLLSLFAAAAQAVPISFQFSSVIESAPIGATGVPAPFDDYSAVLGASITGAFTIETDVETFPSQIFDHGVFYPAGLRYWNPVLSYDLTVAGQNFSFVSARPTLDDGIQESAFTANDLPAPLPNPLFNYDVYQLDTDFGVGQFGSPFAGLDVFASLIRLERDLSVIQSTDMVTALTTPAQWRIFFSLVDTQTFNTYQVYGAVTDLRQVVTTPEPGVGGLLALGLGMLGLAMRRRRSTAASG